MTQIKYTDEFSYEAGIDEKDSLVRAAASLDNAMRRLEETSDADVADAVNGSQEARAAVGREIEDVSDAIAEHEAWQTGDAA